MRYPVIIESEEGTYGAHFPDLPGCVATAATLDEALVNAEDALRDWVECTEEHGEPVPAPSAIEDINVPIGCVLGSILLVRTLPNRQSVRLNLTLDPGVAKAVALEARRRGMTRKSLVEWALRRTVAT